MDKLDDIDKKILRLLQKNARLTTKELADKINLSTSPTFERQKRLEREGYIDKYVALVNPKKLNYKLKVLCNVRLKQHTKEYIQGFSEAMSHIELVTECYNTSGDYDFIIKLYVHDMDEYQDFMLNTIGTIESVGSIHSMFVIGEIKNSHIIPIGERD